MKLNYGSFLSLFEKYCRSVQDYNEEFTAYTLRKPFSVKLHAALMMSFMPEEKLGEVTEPTDSMVTKYKTHVRNLNKEFGEYCAQQDLESVKEYFEDYILPGINPVLYLDLLDAFSSLIKSDASISPARKNSFLKATAACDEAIANDTSETNNLLSGFLSSVFIYAVLQDNRQLEGTIPEPVMAANYPINAKLSRNPYFSGRMEELSLISKNFALGTLSEPSSIQVISGPPGTGKSQLALEYAFLSVESGCSAIWIDAKDDQGFIDAYKALLVAVNLSVDGDENAILRQVRNWAAQHDCLFVLDDADYATRAGRERINRFIPQSLTRKILITTRNPKPFYSYPIVSLESLGKDDSVDFLRKRIGRNNLQEKQLLSLANRLDRLPLALEQAGAYLARYSTLSIPGYIKALNEQTKRLLSDDTDLTPGARSVLETISLTMEQIKDEKVKYILYALAYKPTGFYLRKLVDWGYSEENELERIIAEAGQNEPDFLELLDKLTEFSLCHVTAAQNPPEEAPVMEKYVDIYLHDLVKEALRILNKDLRPAMPAIMSAADFMDMMQQALYHVTPMPPDTPDEFRYTVYGTYLQLPLEVLHNISLLEEDITDPDTLELLSQIREELKNCYDLAVRLGKTQADTLEEFELERRYYQY